MGQYRQWLHYRQVDQQLHTLKEHLAQELRSILEQNSTEVASFDPHNQVVQALLLYAQKPSFPSATSSTKDDEVADAQLSKTFSLLFEQSRLPNFETLFEHNELYSPPSARPTFAPLPPLPHQPQTANTAEAGNMSDNQQQTEPQTALPWWLQRAVLSAPGNGLDQQNLRTNQLVQRWLERWGRQEGMPPSTAKNGDQYQPSTPEEGTKKWI